MIHIAICDDEKDFVLYLNMILHICFKNLEKQSIMERLWATD